jgi:hypothetical protein
LATSIFDIFKTVSPHAKTKFLLHCGIKQQNPVLERAIPARTVLFALAQQTMAKSKRYGVLSVLGAETALDPVDVPVDRVVGDR